MPTTSHLFAAQAILNRTVAVGRSQVQDDANVEIVLETRLNRDDPAYTMIDVLDRGSLAQFNMDTEWTNALDFVAMALTHTFPEIEDYELFLKDQGIPYHTDNDPEPDPTLVGPNCRAIALAMMKDAERGSELTLSAGGVPFIGISYDRDGYRIQFHRDQTYAYLADDRDRTMVRLATALRAFCTEDVDPLTFCDEYGIRFEV